MTTSAQRSVRFVRLGETGRAAIRITLDGVQAEALEGDTLLTALLCNGLRVRDSEFGDGVRAGFCLMGACQDCWVWDATREGSGQRMRACTTVAADGMSILTRAPDSHWPEP